MAGPEGLLAMSPAAPPGTGLSHTPGQGSCRAAKQHLCLTGLPAQHWERGADVAGVRVALGGDRGLHQPSTASLPSPAAASARRTQHRLFTWGEGINKRVITAIYIKLDILKALCKH